MAKREGKTDPGIVSYTRLIARFNPDMFRLMLYQQRGFMASIA
jgi:acetate kinase